MGSEYSLRELVRAAGLTERTVRYYVDGILVLEDRARSNADITATASTDNARTGVMFVGSTGELSSLRCAGNRFGLVLQPGASGAGPTLGQGNAFEGNSEEDKLEGGTLPAPDVATPLP